MVRHTNANTNTDADVGSNPRNKTPTQDHNSTRHVYVIQSELMLVLVIALVMFASLALAKMDCHRLANYFLLPVFLGLAYLSSAPALHTQQPNLDWAQSTSNLTGARLGGPTRDDVSANSHASLAFKKSSSSSRLETLINVVESEGHEADARPLVEAIESTLNQGLAGLSLVHLVTNLFESQLSKLIN